MRWLYCPALPHTHTHSERSPFRAFFLFVDLFDVRFPFRRFVSPLPSCSVSLVLPSPPLVWNLPFSIPLHPLLSPPLPSRGFARSVSARTREENGERERWRWKTGEAERQREERGGGERQATFWKNKQRQRRARSKRRGGEWSFDCWPGRGVKADRWRHRREND